jgi:hypothetical protein
MCVVVCLFYLEMHVLSAIGWRMLQGLFASQQSTALALQDMPA